MIYDIARPLIRDGDLIAIKSTHGGLPWLVRKITKSPYTHTLIAFWQSDRLLAVEQDGVKAVIVPLSYYKHQQFDVYTSPINGEDVVEAIFDCLGRELVKYAPFDLVLIAAHLLFGAALPEHDEGGMVCSAHSTYIYKGAGWRYAGLPSLVWPGALCDALGRPRLSIGDNHG